MHSLLKVNLTEVTLIYRIKHTTLNYGPISRHTRKSFHAEEFKNTLSQVQKSIRLSIVDFVRAKEAWFSEHIWAENLYENATGTHLSDRSPRQGETVRRRRELAVQSVWQFLHYNCHQICMLLRRWSLPWFWLYTIVLMNHSLWLRVCCLLICK